MISSELPVLQRLENLLLAAVLGTVILLAGGQILLRNLTDLPIIWIDPLLRVAVLWLALLGAMVATREQTHIAIDLLSHLMPQSWHQVAMRIVYLMAGTVCGILAWYSLQLVLLEFDDGLFAFARVPVWLCQSIMPVAFAVMAYRFTRRGIGKGSAVCPLVERGAEHQTNRNRPLP